MAVDVVCGKEVVEAEVNRAVGRVLAGTPQTDPKHGTKRLYNGKWYYFCSLACSQKFMANPQAYVG